MTPGASAIRRGDALRLAGAGVALRIRVSDGEVSAVSRGAAT